MIAIRIFSFEFGESLRRHPVAVFMNQTKFQFRCFSIRRDGSAEALERTGQLFQYLLFAFGHPPDSQLVRHAKDAFSGWKIRNQFTENDFTILFRLLHLVNARIFLVGTRVNSA